MYNILICDDEKDIVNALKIYLNDTNYHFLEAFDGEEAVHMVETNEVHLVLMDIMMPKLDGIQAMIRIREKSNVPVILLTAKGEDSDKVLGLTVGADDYITKPFNPIEVSARVKSQLRRYMQLGGGTVRPDVIRVGGIEKRDAGRRAGGADAHGVRDLKASDPESGTGIFPEGDLYQNLERPASGQREYRGGTYPAFTGKVGNQSGRTQILKSSLGTGIQM